MDTSVRHDAENHRFVVEVDGHEAVLEYGEPTDGVLDLYRTYTPEALRGRGVAGRLVEAALAYAREGDLRIVPTCPYVARFVERHPEHGDLVTD